MELTWPQDPLFFSCQLSWKEINAPAIFGFHTALVRFGVLSMWMAKRRQYHLMARRRCDALKPFKSFSRDPYCLLDIFYLQLTSHQDEYAVKEIVCKTQVCG